LQEAKSSSIQNNQRIHQLETELSELQALTWEELGENRTKNDECLVSINRREREHFTEIQKYKREITDWKDKYDSLFAVLGEQQKTRKKRIEQTIDASTQKTNNLQRVFQLLEKHYEKPIQITMKDIERMKSSIHIIQCRNDRDFNTIKNSVTQVSQIQRESK
jgi:RNAse (barnase) inhibitor barstar